MWNKQMEHGLWIKNMSKHAHSKPSVPCREAVVYEGPNPAEGELPVDGPAEEQHGIWIHDHRGRRTRWVPASEERDTRRARCSGRKDGHRWIMCSNTKVYAKKTGCHCGPPLMRQCCACRTPEHSFIILIPRYNGPWFPAKADQVWRPLTGSRLPACWIMSVNISLTSEVSGAR